MAPFPYLPMAAILVSLVSNLVVQMSVFSYAGFMVEYLGVVDDKDKAGYYAGLLTSAFMVGRLISSHFWGVVSDRFGCHFVMVTGLVTTVVLSIAFGTSTTFTWAYIFRFLLGLLNGTMTASKTLVSEVCGKEHEVVGMGVVTTSWSIGMVVGPGVGGILASPAVYFPGTFSEHGIFGRYPYLLPNLVGAGMSLLSLPLVLLFITKHDHHESVFPTFERTRAWWPLEDDNGNDNDGYDGGEANHEVAMSATPAPPQMPLGTSHALPLQGAPTLRVDTQSGRAQAEEHLGCDLRDVEPPPSLLAQAHIRTLLIIEGVYSCVYSGFDEVFVLWSLSSVASGGLDWSSQEIGQVLIVVGIIVLVFEIFAVPNITPRLGVRRSQRLGSMLEVPVYFLVPLLSLVNKAGLPVATAAAFLLVTTLVGTNTFYMGVSLAVNNAVGPDRRGELNGISASVGAFGRAVSPMVFSSLFALSIDGDHPFPFDYRLVFYLLGLLRLAVAYMGWNTLTGAGHDEKEKLNADTPKAVETALDEYIGSE